MPLPQVIVRVFAVHSRKGDRFMNENMLNHAELDPSWTAAWLIMGTSAWDRFWESNWPSRGWRARHGHTA